MQIMFSGDFGHGPAAVDVEYRCAAEVREATRSWLCRPQPARYMARSRRRLRGANGGSMCADKDTYATRYVYRSLSASRRLLKSVYCSDCYSFLLLLLYYSPTSVSWLCTLISTLAWTPAFISAPSLWYAAQFWVRSPSPCRL